MSALAPSMAAHQSVFQVIASLSLNQSPFGNDINLTAAKKEKNNHNVWHIAWIIHQPGQFNNIEGWWMEFTSSHTHSIMFNACTLGEIFRHISKKNNNYNKPAKVFIKFYDKNLLNIIQCALTCKTAHELRTTKLYLGVTGEKTSAAIFF